MSELRHVADQDVSQVVAEAVAAACEKLDAFFPGRDAGGITSNFQGLLEQVVQQMLIGRSQLDGARGYSVHLPQLLIDDAFFGSPLLRGSLFLPVRIYSAVEPIEALDPDGGGFKRIDLVADAWTSYELAARAAFKYLREMGMSIEEAQAMQVCVVAVQPAPGKERGYVVSPGSL